MPVCCRKKCTQFPLYRCPPFNRPCPPGYKPPFGCKSYGPCYPCCDPTCIQPLCCPPATIQATLCNPCGGPVDTCAPSCGPITVFPTLARPRPRRPACSSRTVCTTKRFGQFMKSCLDRRIYRNGEHLALSYAGHIPGEMYVFGRTLPVATSFAKRRLCRYTPYELVDNDGCCSFP